jgi:hypothetical protein
LPYDVPEGNEVNRETMAQVKELAMGLGFNQSIHSDLLNYDLNFPSREVGCWLNCFKPSGA